MNDQIRSKHVEQTKNCGIKIDYKNYAPRWSLTHSGYVYSVFIVPKSLRVNAGMKGRHKDVSVWSAVQIPPIQQTQFYTTHEVCFVYMVYLHCQFRTTRKVSKVVFALVI